MGLALLRELESLDRFSTIFYKGDTSVSFWTQSPFGEGSTLQGKKRSTFFPFRVDFFRREAKQF